MRHPGHLQRMQAIGSAESLNGFNNGIIRNPAHLVDAGPDRFPVEDNGTGTALARFAANFTAGQQELFPQYPGQRNFRVDHQNALNAVNGQMHFLHFNHTSCFIALGADATI